MFVQSLLKLYTMGLNLNSSTISREEGPHILSESDTSVSLFWLFHWHCYWSFQNVEWTTPGPMFGCLVYPVGIPADQYETDV